MQIKPVCISIDNPLETWILKKELGRSIIPTTDQAAIIHDPTEILILGQFQRNAVAARELAVTTVYHFFLLFSDIIKKERIVLCQEPIIFSIVNEKVLQPLVDSHACQLPLNIIIESVRLQVQKQQITQFLHPHTILPVIILFRRTGICPHVLPVFVVWKILKRCPIVNIQYRGRPYPDTPVRNHAQATNLVVGQTVRHIYQTKLILFYRPARKCKTDTRHKCPKHSWHVLHNRSTFFMWRYFSLVLIYANILQKESKPYQKNRKKEHVSKKHVPLFLTPHSFHSIDKPSKTTLPAALPPPKLPATPT